MSLAINNNRRRRPDGGPVIDIHCHLGVPEAGDWFASQATPRGGCPTLSDTVSAEMMRAVAPRLDGLDVRLQDMDRLGIDIQVLSPSPGQYYYDASFEVARSAARTINDKIAVAVGSYPDRFAGMGTLPMQNAEGAVAELRRCQRDLGLRGIEIGTNIAGRDLHLADFEPVFAAAEELNMLVFLHPMGFTEASRLSDHHLNNLIGNPLDTSIALSHLIFGGVLDRHPGLKLCAAHGGGYLAAYSARMDHGYQARRDCREGIRLPPSEYLKRCHFDTLVYSSAQLEALIKRWGADHLCLGSDYPFDMEETDPVGFHRGLDDATLNLILGGNAEHLLGLASERSHQ